MVGGIICYCAGLIRSGNETIFVGTCTCLVETGKCELEIKSDSVRYFVQRAESLFIR